MFQVSFRQPAIHRSARSRPVLRALMASFVALAVLGLMLPANASAEGRRGGSSSARKLGRGVSNMTLGVLAIPGQIMQTTEESGPFVGATWGFAKGVGFMVASEVVGVYEFLTCPFEMPPNFETIIHPEFPWDYFTERR